MKGHRILLRAIAQIVGRRDDCRFVIAGRDVGWDREPFQEFGSLAKLGDRIILLPQTDETAGLMAAADIFVNPSLTEGFPNVVAEAMLCGVPVVATNVGDCDLIVENHGSIVKPDDPDALADSMEFWLNQDSNTREAVGLRGRESIMRRFSIDRIADQYFELYRQLLARPGPAQQRDQ
jgi:glycosyltransferase involved in cell wall biosynthesis